MYQTNSQVPIDLLEAYRLGLCANVLERRIVIEWADQLVMQEETPDYFLIELSLGSQIHINDFTSLLDEYIGENKPEVSKRVILGFLFHQYKDGQITLQQVVRAVDWLAIHLDYSREENSFMAGVDDYYNLVNEGICGTFSDIENFILQFLSAYQGFFLDNRNDWQKLNDIAINQVQVLYQQLNFGN